jgi:aspartate/methionine/tyrosine aminotransferase
MLAASGLIALPGAFMGSRGAEFVRVALVAPLAKCLQAVEILEKVLSEKGSVS